MWLSTLLLFIVVVSYIPEIRSYEEFHQLKNSNEINLVKGSSNNTTAFGHPGNNNLQGSQTGLLGNENKKAVNFKSGLRSRNGTRKGRQRKGRKGQRKGKKAKRHARKGRPSARNGTRKGKRGKKRHGRKGSLKGKRGKRGKRNKHVLRSGANGTSKSPAGGSQAAIKKMTNTEGLSKVDIHYIFKSLPALLTSCKDLSYQITEAVHKAFDLNDRELYDVLKDADVKAKFAMSIITDTRDSMLEYLNYITNFPPVGRNRIKRNALPGPTTSRRGLVSLFYRQLKRKIMSLTS